MSYWRPTQRQKDYFRANTAPKDWARWLPILQASSLCKYSELKGPENSFWLDRALLSVSTSEPGANVDMLSSIWQEWEYSALRTST